MNKNKRICSAKFGFIQKVALNGLQGRRFPTPALHHLGRSLSRRKTDREKSAEENIWIYMIYEEKIEQGVRSDVIHL
jgi:hypothetical protein